MNEKINTKDLRLEGTLKWIHRFVMFITYPFRHFYAFLIMVVVAIAICAAIPLFQGVSIRDIPVWYGQKLGMIEATRKPHITAKPKKVKATKFKKDIKLKHAVFEPKTNQTQNVVEKETPKPETHVAWNIQNKNAVQKEKTKIVADNVVAPKAEPIVQIQKKQKKEEPVQVKEKKMIVQKTNVPELKYQKRDDLDLSYYQTPKHISGEAIIYGANELYIDDTYLYLYGIYTDPNIHNEGQARSYLRSLIAGQNVDCYIVAKTKDDIATAICFSANKNINEHMVRAYLADNVAL